MSNFEPTEKGRIIHSRDPRSFCRLLRRVWPRASWGLGMGTEKGPTSPHTQRTSPTDTENKTPAPSLVKIWRGRRKDLSAVFVCKESLLS